MSRGIKEALVREMNDLVDLDKASVPILDGQDALKPTIEKTLREFFERNLKQLITNLRARLGKMPVTRNSDGTMVLTPEIEELIEETREMMEYLTILCIGKAARERVRFIKNIEKSSARVMALLQEAKD